MPVIEPIANYHCSCGENPLWDEKRKLVFWTDIPLGKIYCHHVQTGKNDIFYEGDVVGGFTLQKEGSLLLFEADRISRLDRDGRRTTLVKNIDPDMDRFNDVIADPVGRVFAGTIGKDDENGGVYRIDLDGKVKCLFKGTGCANGMGFSLDRKLFYWTCSTSKKIFRFEYDPHTGELSNRSLFLSVEQGIPDGLTVDSEGCIWSARWDGHALYRYTPEGKEVLKIDFPVAKVSSAAWGGAELDELYVTTAGGDMNSKSDDGTLYRIKSFVKGLPEFRSAILL